MNKKAQIIMAKEVPKILFYILFLVIVSFILVFIIGIFSTTTILDGALENSIPVLMLWTSSDCLAYSEGERVFPGVIDLEKFNQERLEKCFNTLAQGIELSFVSFDENLEIEELHINREMVSKGLLCGMKKSKVECYKTKKYVLYKQDNEFKRGYLEFKVVTKYE